MTDLPDLVKDFRPVIPENEHNLLPLARLREPLFFASPSYLAAEPTVYTWGHVDDCLVVLKRRWVMGHPVMHLIVPPVFLFDDNRPVGAERAVIDRFAALGVGCKMSALDVDVYDFEAKPLPGQAEFVYATGPTAWPQGRTDRHLKVARNRLERALEDRHLSWHTHEDVEALADLAKRWHAQTGRHRAEPKVVRAWAAGATRGRVVDRRANILVQNGKVVAASLSERLPHSSCAVIVSRLRDYAAPLHDVLPDPVLSLHWADAQDWAGTSVEFMTSGAALKSTGGLASHKTKLRPARLLPVHYCPPTLPLSAAEYHAAIPGAALVPEVLPGQLALGI